MSTILIEIVVILLLIVLNGVFAMSEIVVVSSRKARLQQLANSGKAGARIALELTREPTAFLSTVQVGITLVGVLAGAYGGATLSREIGALVAQVPWLAEYATAIGIGVVVLAITYVSLIIGELVPKRIGLNNPEGIASVIAVPMRTLSRLVSPMVKLLSASTNVVLRLFRIHASAEQPVSEEEIKILIEQATSAGVFEKAEREMVENIFRLGGRTVNAVMTPRKDIVALYSHDTYDEMKRKIAMHKRSHYPLCEGTLDNVLGFVSAKQLLTQLVSGQPLDVHASLWQPLAVPEHTGALNVLERFKKTGKHTAIVVDEYGGLQGIVSLSDMLEAIVGEIAEIEKPGAVQREDGSWLIDGMLPLDQFKEVLHLQQRGSEDEHGVSTVAGIVMAKLGKVPVVGERVVAYDLQLEVIDMDGPRVDKVLVKAKGSNDDTAGDL